MELLGPNNQYLPKIVAVFAEVSWELVFNRLIILHSEQWTKIINGF